MEEVALDREYNKPTGELFNCYFLHSLPYHLQLSRNLNEKPMIRIPREIAQMIFNHSSSKFVSTKEEKVIISWISNKFVDKHSSDTKEIRIVCANC